MQLLEAGSREEVAHLQVIAVAYLGVSSSFGAALALVLTQLLQSLIIRRLIRREVWQQQWQHLEHRPA